MNVLYTAAATASGGREGQVVSDDGVLDLSLAHPKELGGPGGAHTNPEQLFAAGYAACFHSAAKRVAERQELDMTGSDVTARVGLGIEGKAFGITVALVGSFPGLDRSQAEQLMRDAHEVCPYSRATRGNVDVQLDIS